MRTNRLFVTRRFFFVGSVCVACSRKAASVVAVHLLLASYIFFPEEFGKSGPGYRRGGYWGPVDAIHDWCEVNYQSSSWVAEPWNTASSLSYFVPALTLLLFPVPAMDTRFLVLGGILVAVGAGSMLFHASMRSVALSAAVVLSVSPPSHAPTAAPGTGHSCWTSCP